MWKSPSCIRDTLEVVRREMAACFASVDERRPHDFFQFH